MEEAPFFDGSERIRAAPQDERRTSDFAKPVCGGRVDWRGGPESRRTTIPRVEQELIVTIDHFTGHFRLIDENGAGRFFDRAPRRDEARNPIPRLACASV